MFRSDFHYHRSRACAVAAIEQYARGAEGLAHILAASASAEGTKGRCYQNHERELFRLMVTHQGELREVYESGMVRAVRNSGTRGPSHEQTLGNL